MSSFTFIGHHIRNDGYGNATRALAAELSLLSSNVWIQDTSDQGEWPERVKKLNVLQPAVALCVPEWWTETTAKPLIGFAMFETTSPPAEWIRIINERTGALIVPSDFCKTIYAAAGVSRPIHVVPLGVSPSMFPYIPREASKRPYVFFWTGTADLRKGFDVAYQAFHRAFGKSKDVQLLLHFRNQYKGIRFSDPNVTVMTGVLSGADLRKQLASADCFVFPSRGEGWGLPPREAAATGLPVIATNWGGLAHDLHHWGLALKVEDEVPASYGRWETGEIGNWAAPSVNHLSTLMEFCYSNREMGLYLGECASKWLMKNATWQHSAQRLLRVVEEVTKHHVN